MSLQRCTEWRSVLGAMVEVRLGMSLYRVGLVDDVIPDASGIWLAADGFHSRNSSKIPGLQPLDEPDLLPAQQSIEPSPRRISIDEKTPERGTDAVKGPSERHTSG